MAWGDKTGIVPQAMTSRRALVLGPVACMLPAAATWSATTQSRPPQWAQPLPGGPGLTNFYRVNATLYRSAQPTRSGFALLTSTTSTITGDRPIKTVVSLRAFHDDDDLIAASSGLHLEQIRFKTWHPEDDDVVKFLRIATTPAMHPVLVHCQHGSDRTGTMVAIYRIVVDGWTKRQATDEMINGGFGFHPMWRNLRRYIDGLNIPAIKAELARQGSWSTNQDVAR
jgi:protein tyrosine phosphatase (PTP) superfamily phosphohydrolase (DUF442 family)